MSQKLTLEYLCDAKNSGKGAVYIFYKILYICATCTISLQVNHIRYHVSCVHTLATCV